MKRRRKDGENGILWDRLVATPQRENRLVSSAGTDELYDAFSAIMVFARSLDCRVLRDVVQAGSALYSMIHQPGGERGYIKGNIHWF